MADFLHDIKRTIDASTAALMMSGVVLPLRSGGHARQSAASKPFMPFDLPTTTPPTTKELSTSNTDLLDI